MTRRLINPRVGQRATRYMTDILGVYDQMVYDDVLKKYLPATKLDMLGYNLLTPTQASFESGAVTGWGNGGNFNGFFTASNNLMRFFESNFEDGSVAGWASAGGNSTVANSTAQAAEGTRSLAVTSIASGFMAAVSPHDIAAVTPGQTYTAIVSIRAATVIRSCSCTISWYTAGGVFISNVAGTAANDSTSAWVQYTSTAVAPATAAFAAVQISVNSTAAGGEVHYADKAAIVAGSGTVWTPGAGCAALSGSFVALVSRSLPAQNPGSYAYIRQSPPATTAAPCVPGQTYTGMIWIRCGAGQIPVNARAFLRFYAADGVTIIGSDVFGSLTLTSKTAWQQLIVQAVAPVGAAVADLFVEVQDRPNMLLYNDATFEENIGSWGNNANITVAQTTAQALDGTHSLSMTSTAAGDMTTTSAEVPVTAGTQYTALASFRSAVSGRNCRVNFNWKDASHAFLSGANGSQITDTTSGWGQAFVTAVAPASAAFAVMACDVLATGAASEVHYLDKAAIMEGASTTWRPGQNGMNQHAFDQAGIYQGVQNNWTLT